ncbi:sigma 54-interacting transcriptional regulator [Erwinia phyllosphaerae]|uniref:sigma 54-interacting transcriptional regulator n=1 Tax=Erwinia phyllosphaerae TaxID=2853256 RepID=UPI001FEF6CFD|nr:sigma 54-interacting transcriptional regulator [Erwinia phyllosphaerae]MBV4368416.1 sigma 54-interacting transcriptional regulator [Erwinia phyllosphaerae]
MDETSSLPSSLMAIQPVIMNFSSLLANVLGMEVEVVDRHLIRIAGTGPYGHSFGHSPEGNTHLLRKVIETQKEMVVVDSRHNLLCKDCQHRHSCKEQAFIGVPVVTAQRCLGVISLIAVNNEQQRKLSDNAEMFVQYMWHVSRLLVANLASVQLKNPQNNVAWNILLENMDQGVILLDRDGKVKAVNDRALQQLLLPGEDMLGRLMTIEPLSRQRERVRGHIQHRITLGDRQMLLTGQRHQTERQTLFLLAFHQDASPAPLLNEEETPGIERLVGKSGAMKQLKRLVMRIASSPSSVMILGESGTGKEVVARAIHRLSKRHDKPFVAINCAAIPENLLESELFGYVKGAFTGAAPGGRAGLILSANGGTLFLDEIGDMPLSLQARLLRAIESREVLPVGASRPVPVDIRILSATHQKLQQFIAEGKFREDLYYRLNVIPLEVPALRERGGDIELLLHYFLNQHSQRIGCTYPGVSREVIRLLQNYSWPGNVRELSNLVEYLVNIIPEGEIIDSALLPPLFHTHSRSGITENKKETRTEERHEEEGTKLKSVEKSLIEEALQRTRNKKQIAEELGIGVATLYRKIKKYGLRA